MCGLLSLNILFFLTYSVRYNFQACPFRHIMTEYLQAFVGIRRNTQCGRGGNRCLCTWHHQPRRNNALDRLRSRCRKFRCS